MAVKGFSKIGRVISHKVSVEVSYLWPRAISAKFVHIVSVEVMGVNCLRTRRGHVDPPFLEYRTEQHDNGEANPETTNKLNTLMPFLLFSSFEPTGACSPADWQF